MELFAQTTKIVPALIKARSSFKAAVKDSTNPHFKSKYVSLDGVIDAVNDALLANGLFLTQTTYVQDAQTILRTMLLHESGETIYGDYPVHPVKPDPQGEGSALTYARRYALMGLVGIAPEDDDGNAAVVASKPKPPITARPQEGMQLEDFPLAEQGAMLEAAARINIACRKGEINKAAKEWLNLEMPQEKKTAIWFLIEEPSYRTAITKIVPQLRAAA